MFSAKITHGFLLVILFLFLQTCTKKNDFLLQYKPSIADINPTEGYPEAIVSIKGKGFSNTLEDNEVKFNSINATVIEATTTELKVVVPDYATTGKIRIRIYYKGILIDSTTSTQNFVIHNNYTSTPIITNFSPTQASYNTFILMSGKNFSNANISVSDTPIVVVGTEVMEVKTFTDTSILFMISKPLPIEKYVVSVIKKDNTGGKNLIGFSKNTLEIVASSLELEETAIMIGDSLHIKGRGLLSAKNVLLSIGNNTILCTTTPYDDTRLGAKINNDVFEYISPKTNAVFNVSVLFSNQQTLNAGSVKVSTTSGSLIFLNSAVVDITNDVNVWYNNAKITNVKNAVLYLKVNNNLVAQLQNKAIAPDNFTFDKAILSNILGANENSKIVQAEIKVVTNDGNETTYALGNLSVNAVAIYNPITLTNNLRANDIITITGSHIKPDINLYKLTGFSNNKEIPAATATSTVITFKIPTDIAAGKYQNIKLNTGLLNISSLIIIPTITAITPASGGDSTLLNIIGYNLYTKNKIYFDTFYVNKFDSISYPYNSFKDTISSKKLFGNTIYVVGVGDSNSIAPTATASQNFTYTISGLNVFTDTIPNNIAANNNVIKVSGKGIQGNKIILKYNNLSLVLNAIKNVDTLKATTPLTDANIATFNIADNLSEIQAQVFVELSNGTQILAGSILVKPTATITGINPATGSTVKANDVITINGKHLSSKLNDWTLKLGNNVVPVTSANGSSVQFKIPANIPSNDDSVYVKMLSNDLQNNKLHFHLKIAPTITSISPTNGTDGTNVTIQGYNFDATNNDIQINSVAMTPVVVSNNFQTLNFVLKTNTLQAGNSYPINLTTIGGLTATSSQNFTYTLGGNLTVSSDNTNTAILAAGNNLIITGTNFTGISNVVLKYGTASISLLVTATATSIKRNITATDIQSLNIPDNKESDVIQVYLQIGSTQTLAGSILVKPTATITGINPATGSTVKANDIITINGKHLSSKLNDWTLKLGNNVVPVTSANGSSVQFKIPTNIESENYTISLTDGTLNYNTGTLNIVPTITSISPTTGTDGTNVTIQGYNFLATGNTIYIDDNDSIPTTNSTNNLQTLSFKIPPNNNLQAGNSYALKIRTNNVYTTATQLFNYVATNLNIAEVQSLYTDTSHIKISGNGLKKTTLYLRYNNGAYLVVDTINTLQNLIHTKPIGKDIIDLLGIPTSSSSASVGVYILIGTNYTFVGNINIKAITKLYAFSTTPSFVANNTLAIRGDHIAITDNYRIGLKKAPNDTVWFAPTSLNTTSLNLIINDTLSAGEYNVFVKYPITLKDTVVNLDKIIIKPTISSISPNSNIDILSSFTIIGKNLSTESSAITILLNGISYTNFNVTSATQTAIIVRYNTTIGGAGTYPLSIKINMQISSPFNISLKQ